MHPLSRTDEIDTIFDPSFLELFLFFSFGRAYPHGLRLGLKYFDDLNPISFSPLFDLAHWAFRLNKLLCISDDTTSTFW